MGINAYTMYVHCTYSITIQNLDNLRIWIHTHHMLAQRNNRNTTLVSFFKCIAHSIYVNTNYYQPFMRKSRKSIKFMDEIDMWEKLSFTFLIVFRFFFFSGLKTKIDRKIYYFSFKRNALRPVFSIYSQQLLCTTQISSQNIW